jgi:protocatechuate 3,4-dioxygenase beta subunit
MQDFDRDSLTQAVVAQMADTPDPRLREIMAAAVRHLHAFAAEVSLTPEEWLAAIRFLTEVGQACTPHRQEFILLSDTLGLSRMVNILHDGRAAASGTETSLLGPFYREGTPLLPPGGLIGGETGHEVVCMFGHVRDEAGRPVAGAAVEVWQTDPAGAYDLQRADPTAMDYRARFITDADGHYAFRTTLPFGYTIPMDGPVGGLIHAQRRHGKRPAHTHFLISAAGHRELVTALYFAGDPVLDSDVVFGVSQALVVAPVAGLPGNPFAELRGVAFDFTLARAAPGESTGRVGADPSRLAAAAG